MKCRWFVFALVVCAIVISYIDRGNLAIAAPALMREFRMPASAMGVLLSAFFWTYAAFQIPAGAIVDKFGIRRAYAAGFVLWSIASASIALSRGPADVIGLRILLGAAESIGPLASLTFIRNAFSERERGLPTAIYIGGQSIGPALGAFLGSRLLESFGWRTMFAVTGLGALLWLPLWLAAAPVGSSPVPNPAPAAAPPVRLNWKALAGTRAFWLLPACILFSSYFWYFVLTWIPGYLELSRSFSNLEMGRIVGTCLFTMAICNALAGYAADRMTKRGNALPVRIAFAATGYAITAVAILLPAMKERAWVLPVLAVSVCATGIGNANFWAIAQQLAPRHLAGRTIGVLNTLSNLSGAAAPIVTGWLLGPRNNFGPAIVLAGFSPLLAAACLIACGASGLERTGALLVSQLSSRPEA